ATGTPISNSMVEMYTMQRFLDPEGLRSRGLEHFDAWAATFGEVIDTMEISPDGASLRPRSRFARFTNLPELQQMFRAFADVQTTEMLDLPRPRLESNKPIVVACPMSEEQHALQQELVERYERLRSQKVDPRVDNALAITTDGRKLATDARMLSSTAPDFPDSKINRLVENIVSTWKKTAATRGTQMIFADMGVNPTAWNYSPYREIIEKLIAHGIPREQIAAIGDAESDAKKQALFEKVRQGPVHFPSHNGRQRRPPGRGHRRPGALLCRGQGDCVGQPGGTDPCRSRRRTATAQSPEKEPSGRAVRRPPQCAESARDHRQPQ